MKFVLPTLVLLVAVVACFVKFAGAETKAPTTAPTTKPAAAVNEFCPLMSDHKVDPEVTYAYKGKTYAFCCSGCIDDFKADPDKYAAKAK